MIHYKYYLLVISCVTLLLACNRNGDKPDVSEQLFLDYKKLVTEVESDTALTESDLGKSWETRNDSLRKSFYHYKSEVTAHLDNFEAERREEVNAFDDRLEVAFEARDKKYDNVSYRYKLRRELLHMEVAEDDMSRIDTANIVTTYEHFVSTLKSNLSNYTASDWLLIEGWWIALNNRKKAVSSMLQPADLERIVKQEQIYLKLREKALNESRISVTTT